VGSGVKAGVASVWVSSVGGRAGTVVAATVVGCGGLPASTGAAPSAPRVLDRVPGWPGAAEALGRETSMGAVTAFFPEPDGRPEGFFPVALALVVGPGALGGGGSAVSSVTAAGFRGTSKSHADMGRLGGGRLGGTNGGSVQPASPSGGGARSAGPAGEGEAA